MAESDKRWNRKFSRLRRSPIKGGTENFEKFLRRVLIVNLAPNGPNIHCALAGYTLATSGKGLKKKLAKKFSVGQRWDRKFLALWSSPTKGGTENFRACGTVRQKVGQKIFGPVAQSDKRWDRKF